MRGMGARHEPADAVGSSRPTRAAQVAAVIACGMAHAQDTMDASTAEWLWGWDPTPGIVSVHADISGRAIVWRRIAESGALVREEERYRPWLLLDRLDDLQHLGSSLRRDERGIAGICYRELEGPGALRYLVTAEDGRTLTNALLRGASERLGKRIGHLNELN